MRETICCGRLFPARLGAENCEAAGKSALGAARRATGVAAAATAAAAIVVAWAVRAAGVVAVAAILRA